MPKVKELTITPVKRLFRYLRPYTKIIAVILACVFISSGISLILPLLAKNIMDNGLLAGDFRIVLLLSLITLGIVIAEQGIGFLDIYLLTGVYTRFSTNLFRVALKHLFRIKVQYYKEEHTTKILSNLTTDIESISSILDRASFYIFSQVLKMIGGLIGLSLISVKLTILVIGLLPIRLVLTFFFSRRKKKTCRKNIKYRSDMASWFGDMLEGIKEIKTWNISCFKLKQWTQIQRKKIQNIYHNNLLDKGNESTDSLFYSVLTNSITVVGALLVFRDSLTIGSLFAFITFSLHVAGPLFSLFAMGYSFSSVLPSLDRFFRFLDKEEEQTCSVSSVNRMQDINIRFENVSFRYPGNGTGIDNLSFHIQKGEKAVIMGPNGAGKSTLIALLLRFYEPDKGRIFFNDREIRFINLYSYRSYFSLLSQDLYLFDSTIKDNILLNSKKCKDSLYKAAKNSTAFTFIKALPQKFNTVVGVNGCRLSGGERQKLGVARALLQDSSILIFDEPTSHFDAESEKFLIHLITHDLADKTIIIVTHQDKFISYADKIIKLEKGKRGKMIPVYS